MLLIEVIRKLEEEGVLGHEECPEPGYWHWKVLKPEELPPILKRTYDEYGEIRWSGQYFKRESET